MKNFSNLFKKIILVILLIYAVTTFCSQQKILNSYASQSSELNAQIDEASKKQEELNKEKANVSSSEYIESMAREKLDMYLPNERVYVDTSK